MTKPTRQARSLPFRRNFILGILLVFFSRFLSNCLGMEWILYTGATLGLVICIVDVVKALKRMR